MFSNQCNFREKEGILLVIQDSNAVAIIRSKYSRRSFLANISINAKNVKWKIVYSMMIVRSIKMLLLKNIFSPNEVVIYFNRVVYQYVLIQYCIIQLCASSNRHKKSNTTFKLLTKAFWEMKVGINQLRIYWFLWKRI